VIATGKGTAIVTGITVLLNKLFVNLIIYTYFNILQQVLMCDLSCFKHQHFFKFLMSIELNFCILN